MLCCCTDIWGPPGLAPPPLPPLVLFMQIHNWATTLRQGGVPSLEFAAPTKCYVVVGGHKMHLNLSKVPVGQGAQGWGGRGGGTHQVLCRGGRPEDAPQPEQGPGGSRRAGEGGGEEGGLSPRAASQPPVFPPAMCPPPIAQPQLSILGRYSLCQ